MATKKKTGAKGAAARKTAGAKRPAPRHSDTYEAALKDYGGALGLLRKNDFAAAMKGFEAIIAAHADEPELVDRARVYRDVCARRLATEPPDSDDPQHRYRRAVVLTNEGRLEEAIELLGRVLAAAPNDASALYVRASALALQGRSEPSVIDLRKAVSIDPTIRFQAANDPDFDRIRDDAAFIDVIEPTPAGA